jgi:hypothetical protein
MNNFKDEKSNEKLLEFDRRIDVLNESIPNINLRLSILITFLEEDRIKIEITDANLPKNIKIEILNIFHDVFPKINFLTL